MTVGSAGGINVTLKALLDPGDEVIVLSPFFVEFMFYIENHGGRDEAGGDPGGFSPRHRCHRKGHNGKDQGDHRKLPEQPDGRCLSVRPS